MKRSRRAGRALGAGLAAGLSVALATGGCAWAAQPVPASPQLFSEPLGEVLATPLTGSHALAVSAATRRTKARSRATAGSCARTLGSFGVGRWPPACWRPYGSRSPFNTPIPGNPRVSPESSAIVSYALAHGWAFNPDRHGHFTMEAGGSRPVYWSGSGDPLVSIRCVGSYSCQAGMRVHIPRGARPQEQSDAHMTVIDQAVGREYDFWRASGPERGEMTVSAGNGIPIGPGSGTGLGAVGEAANLGLAGGLIRGPELMRGQIDHALVTTVACVQRNDVWPARGHGDALCSGAVGPHFGSLLQLNMSNREIAASGAPRWERAVMRAMARYGVYVVDTNGPGESVMSVINEDDLSFTAFGYPGRLSSFVKSAGGSGSVAGVPIPVAKLRVIMPCVPQRRC